MKKKDDWQPRLFAFIEKNYTKPFAWGTWDCCKFSNAAIKEMTGTDLIPKQLKWKDEASAIKSIKDYGGTIGKSIDKAAKSKKLIPVKRPFLQCGDLVIYKEDSELVGIYDGQAILSPSEDGIEVKPTDLAIRGWRING